MTSSRISDPAINGLMTKLNELRERKKDVNERLAALKNEAKEIDSDLQKCLDALKSVADVLGISLPELSIDEEGSTRPSNQNVLVSSLRERIEEKFREAHSRSETLRLDDLRGLASPGTDDKIVRGTLYSLAQDGVVRKKKGWDWEYVPPEERAIPTSVE